MVSVSEPTAVTVPVTSNAWPTAGGLPVHDWIPTTPPGLPSVSAGGLVGAALNRAFPGFNFLVGSESTPNVVLDALHAVTDLKVLSNPSVVVIDNQVATLMVGSDVPISTGTANVLTTNRGGVQLISAIQALNGC